MSGIDSYKRVSALAELTHRYGAIIRGLAAAVDAVREMDDLPEEASEALRVAMDDTDAQLIAVSDALKRAMEDLPEGWVEE